MILFKSRLIFGLIWKIIKVFFTVIYSVLSFFNLHFTLLLGLIGIVLYFTGALSNNRAVLVVYALLLVLSVLYAVIASVKKLLGLDKKVKRSKGVQIVEKEDGERQDENTIQNQPPKQDIPMRGEQQYGGNVSEIVNESEVPKYFKVRQNPSYIMAEYSNRYVLYKIENGKLNEVRTDYKA